ncbi:MAG: hypothetical protein DSM106950_36035 [Stigonema ocellatum SAG 48.90 = DSM 106950]|nr:hypothetical protein [Stigonema ocellatum SAG 48.90 = DSM 106950]
MSKFLSTTIVVITFIVALTRNPKVTFPRTCASQCGQHPIQFTLAQHIKLEVVNYTSSVVKLEKLHSTNPIPLQPGEKLQLNLSDSTVPNVSLVFWNERGTPLKAIVSKPNFGTLHVELRPNRQFPGDRSLYLREDGRVNVL